MDRQIPKSEQKKAALRRTVPWVLGAAVLAALISFLMATVGNTTVRADKLIFSTAEIGDINATAPAMGSVVPAFEEIINSPISSKILKVEHRSGDVVDAGTPLLVLDLEEARLAADKQMDQLNVKRLELEQQNANDRTALSKIEMQIKVGQMQLHQLEQELRNERYLDSIGSGTTDKVRQAEFALKSAELELEQLKVQLQNEQAVRRSASDVKKLEIEILAKEAQMAARTLGDALIRSPRRATITSIADKIGSQVSQGQQLAVIADLDHYKVNAQAAEGYADIIKPGTKAKIKIGRTTLEGTIASVSPTSVNGMINFDVILADDNSEGLRAGLRPNVYIESGTRQGVIRIENSSFYTRPGVYQLYVDTGDGLLHRRSIELGAASMDHIEVVSGLNQGERVVLNDMSHYKSDKLNLKN